MSARQLSGRPLTIIMTLAMLAGALAAQAAQTGPAPPLAISGNATHDEMLLGMHFIEGSPERAVREAQARNPSIKPEEMLNVASMAGLDDYINYMPEDLAHYSYADFWKWWHEFERYKGDEAGLAAFEQVIRKCLDRGMKVKVDLAYSTWYSADKDWTKDSNLVIGPRDTDEWIHLCDLLGRRYHGKIVLYLLEGESNNLADYWEGAPVAHASEIFRAGYLAFKRADPKVLVSIAGASPSRPAEVDDPKAPADASLNNWVRAHVRACKPYFDDIPMNYFADIADPYHGFDKFYGAIRKVYDDNGIKDAEIGSGESSIQWAPDSWALTTPPPVKRQPFDARKPVLSELEQAWRMNQVMGSFFNFGGTKWMMWGTEFAPGVGWPWRWGFRKYEDWWGALPEDYKVPGTRIVWRNDGTEKEPRKVDLRPAWVRPDDPYHPVWEVCKFWFQAAPPASESLRVPMTLEASAAGVTRVAAWLSACDRCVALIYSETAATVSAAIDLKKTAWADGTALKAHALQEDIDYATGQHTTHWEKTLDLEVKNGAAAVSLPEGAGFTTIRIERAQPEFAAEYVQQVMPAAVEVAKAARGQIVVRNTGKEEWKPGKIVAAPYDRSDPAAKSKALPLEQRVAPGQTGALAIEFPAQERVGYTTCQYRLRDNHGHWFGPVMSVSTEIVELEAPRKFVAHRELGHVRLVWFAPVHREGVESYRIYRAPGFQKEFKLLAQTQRTDYIDENLDRDKAFYYYVVAVRADGRRSRPSNEDNARALSRPRIWDAEIVAHTVPAIVKMGEPGTAAITIKNTGQRAWDLAARDGLTTFRLNTTQLWGSTEEGKMTDYPLGSSGVIEPGQTVSVQIPYAAPAAGLFENHWVVCLDAAGKGRAFVGTPLLVETEVADR
jgi:hypothetical protein